MLNSKAFSDDEIALRNLMAKTIGNGVISCFVPTQKPRPRNRGNYFGQQEELLISMRTNRTLTPTYHARKTHFILGGSESSKPTTALTSSTN